ncbi:MAG: hypothetical protein H6807_09850 [Planctomycetes bacterium]|nr:hypothetical protein [Planctomycetota bacterium]
MTRTIILTLLLLTGKLLAQDDAARLELLRQRARALEARVPELKKPPQANLAGLPIPDLALLRLAGDFDALATEANDLDLAPGLWLEAGRIRRALGDPTGALDELALVASHALAVPQQKIEARRLRAAIWNEGGGHEQAAKEWDLLIAEQANDRAVETWRQQAEAARGLAAEQAKSVAEFRRALTSGEGGARARTDQAMRRFLVAKPLAPEAPAMLTGLLAALGEQPDPAARLPIDERLALYAPDLEGWNQTLVTTMAAEAREGEYELALLLASRTKTRPGAFSAAQIEAAEALAKRLDPLLSRIAQRRLEVEPVTKRHRLIDIRRRARRDGDAELLAELIQDFVADYPGASENEELNRVLARALENTAPERALALYRGDLARKRGGAEGYDSLRAAARLAEELEGPEAALALHQAQAPLFGEGAQAIPLALERARLLDRLERWEEAPGPARALEGQGPGPRARGPRQARPRTRRQDRRLRAAQSSPAASFRLASSHQASMRSRPASSSGRPAARARSST